MIQLDCLPAAHQIEPARIGHLAFSGDTPLLPGIWSVRLLRYGSLVASISFLVSGSEPVSMHVMDRFFRVQHMCQVGGGDYGDCGEQEWSSFYPDLKSDLPF